MAKHTTADKELAKEFTGLSGWEIAKRIGCEYSGDSSPIPHEGFFYDLRDWESFGYANCLEFWIDPESPKVYGAPDTLIVSRGTIHRLRGEELRSAYDCIGCEGDGLDEYGAPLEPSTVLRMEVDAARVYAGIEPDQEEFRRAYKLTDWHEWRIWLSVLDSLRSLSS